MKIDEYGYSLISLQSMKSTPLTQEAWNRFICFSGESAVRFRANTKTIAEAWITREENKIELVSLYDSYGTYNPSMNAVLRPKELGYSELLKRLDDIKSSME